MRDLIFITRAEVIIWLLAAAIVPTTITFGIAFEWGRRIGLRDRKDRAEMRRMVQRPVSDERGYGPEGRTW